MENRDALGNVMKDGYWYAHTVRGSGYVEVTVGRYLKLEEGVITLSEVIRGRAYGTNEIHGIKSKRSIVSLSANSVIPITGKFINWALTDEN